MSNSSSTEAVKSQDPKWPWLLITFWGAVALLLAFLLMSLIGFDYFLAEPNSYPKKPKLRAVKLYETGSFLGLGSFVLFAINVFYLPKSLKKNVAIGLWIIFGLIVFASLFQAIIMSILHAPH